MTRDSPLDRDPIVVLHVDDDEQMRLLFQQSLQHADDAFTVYSAPDPPAALERLDDDIECIVSDYEMPTMNGLEFLREVRAERPDLPFILLTGKGSEELASEAISAGLTDYFQKSDIARQFPVLAQRIETAVEGERAEISYRELFEKAVDGLALNDPETGAFVDANPAFRNILGLNQEELMAMAITDIRTVPPQDEQETTLADRLQRAGTDGTTRAEECCRRADGERFWMELQFKPIEVKGRSLVLTQAREITERKRYERTLSALHTAVTDIVGAEQPRQVTGSVLSTVTDLLAADRAAVFLHASAENWLEVADATSLAGVVDEVPLDPEHPLARAFIDGHTVEVDGQPVFERAAEGGRSARTLFVPIGAAGVLAAGYDDARSFESDDREFGEILTNAAAAAFERIEKEREVNSSQAELREQTAELQRLERINATLRDLNDTLLRAETREEVFEAVCEQLSGIEDVKLAWVGTPTEDGTLEPCAWAGAVPEYLDSASFDLASSEEPAVVAARTDTTVRIGNTVTNIRQEPWRRTALSHGVESVMTLPIAVEGITFGVLSVLAADRTAFDGRFADLLSSVATSVGETIYSIEQRRGIQGADTAELTFEITGDEHLLKRLAADADCELEVTGVISEPDDTCRVFLTVHGEGPERLRTTAAGMSAVRNATVATTDDDGAVELHLEVPLLGVQLSEHAVRITQLHASPDSVRTIIEVANPDEVRDVASALRDRYPEASLLSKRSRTDERSDSDRLLAFRESLTPRQREVVHMAYLNGYFESPRRCTGDELGEKLGISSQAVYQHIRAAERRLFDEAFRQILAVSTPGERFD